jgi:hypothetical protein
MLAALAGQPVGQSCDVVLWNVRVSFTGRPRAPDVSKQAVTVRLWTSKPQQMVKTTFMTGLLS